jgi:acetyl-CoA acetyltransferase
MPDAVIVSTARTGIGKAYRGAFNNTHGATLGGHVVAAAGADRAAVEALPRRPPAASICWTTWKTTQPRCVHMRSVRCPHG